MRKNIRCATAAGDGRNRGGTRAKPDSAAHSPKKTARPPTPSTQISTLEGPAAGGARISGFNRQPWHRPALDQVQKARRSPTKHRNRSHRNEDHRGIDVLLRDIENATKARKRTDKFCGDKRCPRCLQRQA